MQRTDPVSLHVSVHAPLPRQRTWPALLTLTVMAFFIGEVLSSATPILYVFLNPPGSLFNIIFYGGGAVLVRDLARRRGNGWGSILWLGAAYGIIEEGVMVTSWYSPYWADVCRPDPAHQVWVGLCDYGRIGGLNGKWALSLTWYHAVFSITAAIMVTEALFPQHASKLWLSRRGRWWYTAAFLTVTTIGTLLFGFVLPHFQDLDFQKHGYYAFVNAPQSGYAHPPLSYLISFGLVLVLGWLGLRLRQSPVLTPLPMIRKHSLWALRIPAFLAYPTFAFFIPGGLQNARVPGWITVVLLGCILGASILFLRYLSGRPWWSDRHRFALIAGGLGFFCLVFDPIAQLSISNNGKPETGMAIVGFVGVVALIWLSRRIARRDISFSQHMQ